MKLRRLLFWIHLVIGVTASLIILTLCITGVLLSFQREITAVADSRRMFRTVAAEGQPLPLEQLVSGIALQQSSAPTSITMWHDPRRPIAVEFPGQRVIFVDPYNGAVLGEGSQSLRTFFRNVTDWHRWLAAKAEFREAGRWITGAANLMFVGLMCSGAILWMPRRWSWRNVQSSLWFRGNLRGRAREWNWHNVVAIWCLLPLLIIGTSGVVMSYRWANNLVYRLTGNPPPPPRGLPADSQRTKQGSESSRLRDPERPGNNSSPAPAQEAAAGLSLLFHSVQQAEPKWTSITLRPTSERSTVSFTVLTGPEGRPDLRQQLTLDRATGAVISSEGFRNFNAGRRLRTWLRFAHTGEAGGSLGQYIAALASMGGAFLVYTGLSLTTRRLLTWRASRRATKLSTRTSNVVDQVVVTNSYATDDSQSTFS